MSAETRNKPSSFATLPQWPPALSCPSCVVGRPGVSTGPGSQGEALTLWSLPRRPHLLGSVRSSGGSAFLLLHCARGAGRAPARVSWGGKGFSRAGLQAGRAVPMPAPGVATQGLYVVLAERLSLSQSPHWVLSKLPSGPILRVDVLGGSAWAALHSQRLKSRGPVGQCVTYCILTGLLGPLGGGDCS